ncbi:hypothetical protein [Anaerotignum propionicum]|uniref:hypothetical protein n=1 Tax=Anaerotignum propionicum TaxID=28446 RepID=UPI00210DDA43|nr:hypothetical protein [Anaerotignum propionicum]MCQ4936305.1 hypothetical protein [Anaerotignum propionicum]
MRYNTPMNVIGIVLLSVVIFVIYVTFFHWVTLYFGISSMPDPPVPKITHGEFPFRLEFEIDGKTVVVEDTLICEYDGVGMDEGRGNFVNGKNI